MITSNLDSAMQLALEGPDKDYDNIIEEAIVLWKNSSKFRHLFTNPKRYLVGASENM